MLLKFPALTLCDLKLSKANLPIAANAYKSRMRSLTPLRSHLWAELSATWGHPAFTTWSSTPRPLQSCSCSYKTEIFISGVLFCFLSHSSLPNTQAWLHTIGAGDDVNDKSSSDRRISISDHEALFLASTPVLLFLLSWRWVFLKKQTNKNPSNRAFK